MQEHALAIEKEEQLAQGLSVDKSGRKHLLNTCGEFQGAVHKLTAGSFLQNLERALRTEVGASKTTANEETPQHGVDSAAATQADDSAKASQWQGDRLVVPNGRGYAKMYESFFGNSGIQWIGAMVISFTEIQNWTSGLTINSITHSM